MNLYRKLTTFLVVCTAAIAILCLFGMLYDILHETMLPTGDAHAFKMRGVGLFTAFIFSGTIAVVLEMTYRLIEQRDD